MSYLVQFGRKYFLYVPLSTVRKLLFSFPLLVDTHWFPESDNSEVSICSFAQYFLSQISQDFPEQRLKQSSPSFPRLPRASSCGDAEFF